VATPQVAEYAFGATQDASVDLSAMVLAGVESPRRHVHRAGHVHTPAGAHVSELKSGSPSVCSQWLTVMFSWVNSPVQISTPIPISTTPPAPITTA